MWHFKYEAKEQKHKYEKYILMKSYWFVLTQANHLAAPPISNNLKFLSYHYFVLIQTDPGCRLWDFKSSEVTFPPLCSITKVEAFKSYFVVPLCMVGLLLVFPEGNK